MASYLIQDSTLTNLGNKIRTLTNTTDTMTPAVMADRLDAFADKVIMLSENVTEMHMGATGWKSIAYCNGVFAAVGTFYNSSGYKKGITAYSTDCVNWTSSMSSNRYYDTIVCFNDKLLAVANKYTTYFNGTEWISSGTNPASSYVYGLATNGTACIGAAYNSNKIVRFTDPNNITALNALPVSAKWKAIAHGEVPTSTRTSRFLAIAEGSDIAVYSDDDGYHWTTVNLPISQNWSSVTYGNGKFVAVAKSSNTAAYSEDGITWTSSSLQATADLRSVAYGNGKFVAVSYGTDTAIYSTDGITWNSTTLPSSQNWTSVTYGGGKFVAISSSSDIVAISEDGINWTNKIVNPILVNASNTDITEEIINILKAGLKTCTVEVSDDNAFISSIAYTKTENGSVFSQVEDVVGSNITLENVLCNSYVIIQSYDDDKVGYIEGAESFLSKSANGICDWVHIFKITDTNASISLMCTTEG